MSYKILLADDEKNSQNQIRSLMKSYPDYEISHSAASGTQALEKLRKHSFDLAFLDVGMPGLTGIEVLKEINADSSIQKPPYVIFITAFTHLGAEAYNLGAVDYLVKPVSERRLDEALKKFRIYNSGEARYDDSASERLPETNTILENKYRLTRKEIEICLLIKDGLIREEILNKLNLSPATMKTHLSHIYDKTGLSNSEKNSGRSDKFSRLLFFLFNLK